MATPSRPDAPLWRCPRCGPLTPAQVEPYDEDLRRRRFPGFEVAPVAPSCRLCGAALAAPRGPVWSPGSRVVVLTGTCGSGKSTVAARLMARHGYGVIDGDQVIGWIKDRYGAQRAAYDGPDAIRVIESQLDCLLALGRDVALAQVVLPVHLPRYRALLRARGVAFRFVVLRPSCDVALARTRLRTCFNGVTPPEVVLGFHQAFAALDEAVPDMTVLDNSTGTADDVADWIVGLGQASAPDAPPGRESGCAATVRPLFPADLDDAVLAAFDRYQETAQVWYYVGQAAPPFDSSDAGADRGYWEIRADRFVDDWDAAAKRRVIAALRGCLAEGGAVVGALAADGRLLGFASLRNAPLGHQGDKLELDYLHVSRECRGCGLGRRLFAACCCAARARGAARLYLGAHPSVETQRFYRALGCVPAAEIVAAVYAREPRDIQLEFVL